MGVFIYILEKLIERQLGRQRQKLIGKQVGSLVYKQRERQGYVGRYVDSKSYRQVGNLLDKVRDKQVDSQKYICKQVVEIEIGRQLVRQVKLLIEYFYLYSEKTPVKRKVRDTIGELGKLGHKIA